MDSARRSNDSERDIVLRGVVIRLYPTFGNDVIWEVWKGTVWVDGIDRSTGEADPGDVQGRMDSCLDISERELIELTENPTLNICSLTQRDVACLEMSWQILREFKGDAIRLMEDGGREDVLELACSIADALDGNDSVLKRTAPEFAEMYAWVLRNADRAYGEGRCLDLSRVLWRDNRKSGVELVF